MKNVQVCDYQAGETLTRGTERGEEYRIWRNMENGIKKHTEIYVMWDIGK